MTYIIAEPCIDIKDRPCVDVCPTRLHPVRAGNSASRLTAGLEKPGFAGEPRS
jgi:hypothetical protein